MPRNPVLLQTTRPRPPNRHFLQQLIHSQIEITLNYFANLSNKLRQLKLDYNIVVFLANADVVYSKNCGSGGGHTNNFFFLLRQIVQYLPPYLKFVFTFTTDSIINQEEISRVLLLKGGSQSVVKNEIYLSDRELFTSYHDVILDLLELPSSVDRDDFVDKCDGDFERLLDVVEMSSIGIPFKAIADEYNMELLNYYKAMTKSISSDSLTILIDVLSQLQMPISIELLSQLIEINENKLNKAICEELKSLIWTFEKKKSESLIQENDEETKGEPLPQETTTYAWIKTTSNYKGENPVLIHNKIVKILRKNVNNHYSLHWIWYHISECDEDFTKEYLIEEERKLNPDGLIKTDLLDDEEYLEERSKNVNLFDIYSDLFKSQYIFDVISYHKGFEFLIREIGYIVSSEITDVIEKERNQLLNFRNILFLIEQTIKGEKFWYADFWSQLRGRIIGADEHTLMHKLRNEINSQNITYFKCFQNSLRENAKIESILKFPYSSNRTWLFEDQRRVAIVSDSGLIYIWDTSFEMISVISNEYANITCCVYYSIPIIISGDEEDEEQIEEEEILLTGGQDPFIRKYDIASQREIAHYQCHKSDCTILKIAFEYFFSTGKDKRLVKFNIDKEKIERVYKSREIITALQILENRDDKEATKILISTEFGYLELLDIDLGLISSLSVSNPNEKL